MGASFIIQNILAALLPVGVDAAKAVIGRFGGGVRPTNIDEQIKLDGSQVDKLKALATLDNPYGTPSQWVVDLRASFRYIAAAIVIIFCKEGVITASFKVVVLSPPSNAI